MQRLLVYHGVIHEASSNIHGNYNGIFFKKVHFNPKLNCLGYQVNYTNHLIYNNKLYFQSTDVIEGKFEFKMWYLAPFLVLNALLLLLVGGMFVLCGYCSASQAFCCNMDLLDLVWTPQASKYILVDFLSDNTFTFAKCNLQTCVLINQVLFLDHVLYSHFSSACL